MAGVHPQQRTTLDLLLCQYLDALGSTERIQKTPIPRAYTRHTSRFLLLWLLLPALCHLACLRVGLVPLQPATPSLRGIVSPRPPQSIAHEAWGLATAVDWVLGTGLHAAQATGRCCQRQRPSEIAQPHIL